MIEAMIDIETLSTRNNAVVLSIGAQMFCEDALLPEQFYCVLNVDEQIDAGRRVDGSTLRWWMKQSDEAKRAIFNVPELPVVHALVSLRYALETSNVKRVWAKGLHFDIAILDSLGLQFGVEPHWKYNEPRDTRTYMDLLPAELTPKFQGTAHNALDDARDQTNQIIAAREHLNNQNRFASAFASGAHRDPGTDTVERTGIATAHHAGGEAQAWAFHIDADPKL